MERCVSFAVSTEEGLKTIDIKIKVTIPNKYGNFNIITQIGDETPNVRQTSIRNKNIVKDY